MSEAVITTLALAKGNAAYRRALQSDPRYVRAVQLREQVLAAQLTLPGVPRPESPLTADVSLLDWLDAMVSVDSAERERDLKLGALRALLRDCEAEVVTAATLDPDRLLRSFDDDLEALLSDLAPVVQRLGGATSPGEAVEVGDAAVAAWRELPALRECYDEVRAAQFEVMKNDHVRRKNAHSPVFDDLLASDLVASNWDSVLPTWRGSKTTYVHGAPELRPWPLNDPVAQLVWMITSGLQLWVPTREELDQLHAARRRRLNPVKQQRPLGPGWTVPAGVFDDDAAM